VPEERDAGVRAAEDLVFAIGDDALPALRDIILCAGEIEKMIARIFARNDQFFVMPRRIIFCSPFVDRYVPMSDVDLRIAVLETRNADVIVVGKRPIANAGHCPHRVSPSAGCRLQSPE
jgi:hypothetical protein